MAPIQPRAIEVYPAVSPWLIFAGAVLAVIAIVYLYSAQQKIARRAVVHALMTIRIALVLMVILLLLGPVRQWIHTAHSNGTLFVLIDQSQSMRQKDPQSTDTERLHWADALGYLPAESRPPQGDVWVSELSALRDDLDRCRSDADHLQGDGSDSDARASLAASLNLWQTDARSLAEKIGDDPQTKLLASDVPASLKSTAETIENGLVTIRAESNAAGRFSVWCKIAGALLAIAAALALLIRRGKIASPMLARLVPAMCVVLVMLAVTLGGWAGFQWPQMRETAGQPALVQVLSDNAQIPWQSIHDMLGKSIAQLAVVAGNEDRDFLKAHASDPRVQDALSKVRRMSRADLACAALTADSAHQLSSLAGRMNLEDVLLVPFGDHASLVTPEKNDLPAAVRQATQDPAALSTDIASALKLVTEQAGDDSSVVLISDGRQNIGTEPEAPAKYLAARGTRVFALSIGSNQVVRDAAVDHVDAPDWVYFEDQVVVSPVIRLDGLRGQTVKVELRRDNQIVDTRTLVAKSDQEKTRLRLTDRPPKEGSYDYSVVIQPVPDEAVSDNNRQSVRLAVKKDRLNVLMVEDEPGWEYQFLRNYLARDHRMKLQVVLTNPAHIEEVQPPQGTLASPDREDGKIDAQVLPSTRAQWSAFDIVILGDVPPEKLSAAQQSDLAEAVRDGGVKALLLIAGQRNMPMRYGGTPLAELIPVELSGSNWQPQELTDQLRHGYVPAVTPEGAGSILGQMSDDFETNSQIWANLPAWYWHSEWTTARPGASVIWSIEDALAAGEKTADAPKNALDSYEQLRQHALLATMNIGLGRVMYLASPQTWRLRYVQTPGDDSHIEDVHRRFWGQVVRWAAGNDLPAGGKFVRFGADKYSCIGGEPIVITARVTSENFTPMQAAVFKTTARRADGSAVGETTMTEAPTEGPGIYRGTLTLPAGSYELGIDGGEPGRLLAADTTVDAAQKTLKIDVAADAAIEDRDVNTDPQRMIAIAKAGNGIATDGCYFDVLASRLPVINRTQTQVTQAGLFSNPRDRHTQLAHWAFFAVFVTLLTAEWILRKRGGLV